MNLLFKIARIPFVLWLLIGAGLAYMDYTTWQNDVEAMLVSEKDAKTGQLTQLKRETGRAEDFRRRKEDKLRELQTLSAQLEAARGRFPATPNIPQLLKDLADVSDKTGLEFHSFRPQAEKRQEFVVTTPIEVKLRGTYVQVMSFLDTAANLKRTVASEQLIIDSPPGSRDKVASVVNAQATLVTYSVEDTPPPAAPAAPAAKPGAKPAPGKGR